MTKRWMFLLSGLLCLSLIGCDKKEGGDTTDSTDTEATAEETTEETSTEEATEEKTEEKTDEESGAAKKTEDKKADSGDAAKHLDEATAKGLFPKKLGGYKLDSFKVVKKSDKWHELKTNYKGKSGVLKVIINDYPPKGNPEWETLIKPAKEEFEGYTSMMEKKGKKHTLMVLVEKRYRVDFKSTDLKPEEIEKIAKDFDFKKVKKAHK